MATFTHPHPFDPTYGYSAQALLAIAAPEGEPSDFDAFWRQTHERSRACPLALTRKPFDSQNKAFSAEIWSWDSPGTAFFADSPAVEGPATHRIGAWLTLPRLGEPEALIVVGHGYGGREAPDYAYRKVAALHVCMPGFNLSAAAGLPNASDAHVIHGIQSREGYLLRSCAAAMWSAATALLGAYPALSERLYYEGGSFGGGMGALMLPWDDRFKRAVLCVPTFGHHPLRLKCPCIGSGESVRRWNREHPEVTQVLSYFDAATAARRIRIPTLCAPALFDPAVPPPGQFAVANSLAGPKRLFILSAGHHEHPSLLPEQVAFARMTADWMDPDREPWRDGPERVWAREA